MAGREGRKSVAREGRRVGRKGREEDWQGEGSQRGKVGREGM